MARRRRRTKRVSGWWWAAAAVVVALACWYFFFREEGGLEPLRPLEPSGVSSDAFAEWKADLQAGNAKKVIEKINTALAGGAVKNRAAALWLLAEAHAKAGDEPGRRKVLERLARDFPNTDVGVKARAEISASSGGAMDYFLKGDYRKAAKAFELKLEDAPEAEKAEILWYLGRSKEELGAKAAAAECFRKIVDGCPGSANYADACFKLAAFTFDAGHPIEALKTFVKGSDAGGEGKLAVQTAKHIGPSLYEMLVADGKRAYWDDLRELYCVLWRAADDEERPAVEKKLDKLNAYLIFTPVAPCRDAVFYTVKPGDSLSKIALKHHTKVGLIKRLNLLKSDTIYPGQKLKILQGKATIIVRKSLFRLTLLFNDRYIRSYPVGIGRAGLNTETPTGQFKIVALDVDPVWYKGDERIPPEDPRNILGTRWIGLDIPHYGIHGTRDESSVGKTSSAGCIRMRNRDVEEVYDFVSIGDLVIIED